MEPQFTHVSDAFDTSLSVSEASPDVLGRTSLEQPLSRTDPRGPLSSIPSIDRIPVDSPVPGDAEMVGETTERTGKKKKMHTPGIARVAFHTTSAEDVLDDGYKWRKYGQKSVKNTSHPRSYYRCAHHTCLVKKQIQRLSKDTSIVVTTYEGIHNHPCEKLMETMSPLLKQLQFLCGL